MERHGVLVAHSISAVKNGQTVADILNLSPAPITIRQHERIAFFPSEDTVLILGANRNSRVTWTAVAVLRGR